MSFDFRVNILGINTRGGAAHYQRSSLMLLIYPFAPINDRVIFRSSEMSFKCVEVLFIPHLWATPDNDGQSCLNKQARKQLHTYLLRNIISTVTKENKSKP